MEKLKYLFLQLILGCILSGISVSQLYSQKTIKIGVVYTSNAENSIKSYDIEQKAKNQIEIINQVLQNSGINDLKIEVSYTKLHTYQEPKYRKDGYIRFSYDGTYQILDEISNHASLMDYFIDNKVNSFDENGVNYIDQDELSQSLISINASTKPNVVLFIADEDGPSIISEYLPQNISSYSSRTFFSVINSKALVNIDISLALGFLGVFIDDSMPDLDSDNIPSKSSFLSFWEYDDTKVQRKLSAHNKDVFKCNVSKLNLKSPDKMEVGGIFISSETQNSVMDVQNSLAIVPASPVNKRTSSLIAPDGDNYSVAMVTKRPRFNDPICINQVESKNLYYSKSTATAYYSEEYIDTDKEFTDISLFATQEIKVYPNPTNGVVNFDFIVATPGDYRLMLYNSYGQQVITQNHKNLKRGLHKIKADFSDLNAGVYIYRIASEVEKPLTGKLILK